MHHRMVATLESGAETVVLKLSALGAAVLEQRTVQGPQGGAAPVASVVSPLDPSWIGLHSHNDKGTNINKR